MTSVASKPPGRGPTPIDTDPTTPEGFALEEPVSWIGATTGWGLAGDKVPAVVGWGLAAWAIVATLILPSPDAEAVRASATVAG